MKKLLLKILLVLALLLAIAILTAGLFLDTAVKRGIETFGPKLTQVDITLDQVSLSMLSGSGRIQGLVIGNPQGFKTPQAIRVGSARLEIQPMSLLSDKIVIKSINVQQPEITFEGGFGGNNLSKILANVNAAVGSGTNAPAAAGSTNAAPQEAKAGKKLEVDDFLIAGAKLNVSLTDMGGKMIPVVLPDIHLTDLGTGTNGITPAELTKVVLSAIEKSAVTAAKSAVSDLGKNSAAALKDLGKGSTNALDSVTKGIGNLFKKK
jgi:uncharacterized protein involved in outer membrane biogenesis